MNVGGHRLTNHELCQHAESLGFADVLAYRASGNLVVEAPGVATEVEGTLESGLRKALGYEVPVMVRTVADLAQLVDDQPFISGKPQVVFRKNKDRVDVDALETSVDAFQQHTVDLYWLPERGISGTEIDMKAFGAVVGINTVRTIGTIQGILKKIESLA